MHMPLIKCYSPQTGEYANVYWLAHTFSKLAKLKPYAWPFRFLPPEFR